MELGPLPDPFIFLARVCSGFTHEELLMTETYFDTLKLMDSTKDDEEAAIQCGILITEEEFITRYEEGELPMFCIIKRGEEYAEYKRDDFAEFWDRVKMNIDRQMERERNENGF
ncbi:MAG: hypothetical protein ACW99G_18270 [Candidatus Thorarchaeota archaeon]